MFSISTLNMKLSRKMKKTAGFVDLVLEFQDTFIILELKYLSLAYANSLGGLLSLKNPTFAQRKANWKVLETRKEKFKQLSLDEKNKIQFQLKDDDRKIRIELVTQNISFTVATTGLFTFVTAPAMMKLALIQAKNYDISTNKKIVRYAVIGYGTSVIFEKEV